MVLAFLIALGTAGAFMAAATGPVAAQETPENATVDNRTTVEEGDFSLTELRRGGTAISTDAADAQFNPPGGRLIDNGSSPAYLIHYPPGPTADEFAYLESGETVESRQLTLLSSRWGKNVKPLNYTLVVVYWQPDTRTVTADDGTTTTENYAANQTVQKTELTLESQNDPNDVRLQPKFGETWQVTAWLEHDGEAVEGARWLFEYRPVPTSKGLPFEDRFDSFLNWAIVNFLLTSGIGSVLAIVVGSIATRRAGPAPALKLGGIVAFIGLLLYVSAFGNTLSLIVAAPYLLSIPVVVAALITTLYMSASSFGIRAEQPHTTEVTDPLGEEVPSIETERAAHYAGIRYPNGDRGIIEPRKLTSWLARFFADTGRIPSGQWSKLVQSEGLSPEAEKIYVDQDSEELIDFTPAGWRVRLLVADYISAIVGAIRSRREPVTDGGQQLDLEADADEDPDRPGMMPGWPSVFVAGLIGIVAGVVMLFSTPEVAETAQTAAWAAGLSLLFLRVEPTPGRAFVEPAPAHATAAKAARIVEQEELEKWRTLDELSERIADREFEGLDKVLDVLDSYREQTQERLDRVLGHEGNGGDGRSRSRSSREGVGADDD